MESDLTGAYCHRDTGKTMVTGGRYGSYSLSFVNAKGQVAIVYRSTAWLRRSIRNGILTRAKEGTCPTS